MKDSGHPSRSVFVLDKDGVIRWSYHAALDEQRDVNDIITALEEIQGP